MMVNRSASELSTSRQRPVILTLKAIFALVVINLAFVTCRQVQIYQRYEVASSGTPNTTSIPSYKVHEQTQSSKEAENDVKIIRVNRAGRSIEYNSPIKRILELLSQHHHHSAPVIVVSSNQNEQPPSTQSHANIGTTSPTASSDNRQQWTLVGNPTNVDTTSPMLAAQHLIQTSSIPYGQYYLASGNMAEDPQPQQIAVVPTLVQAQVSPYDQQQQQQQPQIAYLPASTNPQQFGQQQANNLEENVQPIFLSSYVPQIQTSMPQQQPSQYTQQPVGSSAPNSIQQVQQSQRSTEKSINQITPKNSEQAESENDNNHADDEPAEPAEGGPSTASRDTDSGPPDTDMYSEPNGEGDEHESSSPEGSSGSSSYEDKYDSDKDPARAPTESSENHAKTNAIVTANALAGVGLNDDCMQCICRASSGCDQQLRCITRGSEEKYCGPFQLTEEYWNMAGSPDDSPNNFSSFEDCANDVDCAVTTVTNYMKKYHKDCDGDDNITCMDYARLHRLKQDECSDTVKLANHFDAYWARFQNCAEGYNRSRTGDDEFI